MPDAFAGGRTQAQDRVCEQVVTVPVRAIKIVRGGAGGRVNEAAALVECDAGPRVGAAAELPCLWRPGVVAEFPRVRNGVERPLLLPRVEVECTDVAGRGG